MPATSGGGVTCGSVTGRVASAGLGLLATFAAGSAGSGAAGPGPVHAGLDNITTVSREVGRIGGSCLVKIARSHKTGQDSTVPQRREYPGAPTRTHAPMRPRLLLAVSLAGAACRPPATIEAAPVVPGAPVALARAPAPAPAPAEPAPASAEPAPASAEPAPASAEPAPTWQWAVSVLPELAGHSEVDPGEAALARFVGWFGAGGSGRVYLLLDGVCHAVDGTMSEDGFHGSWQTKVTIRGNERRVSGMSLEITRGGVTESGPGGLIYERDRRGRWQEVGGYGVGSFATIVDEPMSAADDQSLTFAGYWYGLEPSCERTESVTWTCIDGGQLRCERCAHVGLRRRVEGRGGGGGTIGGGRVERTPVDCTRACPADEWTPLLPRLATALAGRRFSGVLERAGPVVFRGARSCARERRRLISAAAGARKAEGAGRD